MRNWKKEKIRKQGTKLQAWINSARFSINWLHGAKFLFGEFKKKIVTVLKLIEMEFFFIAITNEM